MVHDQVTTVRTVLESLTRDYLRRGDGADILAGVARDRPAAVALEAALSEVGTALRHRRRARLAEAMVDGGIEPDAAVRWACRGELEMAADVAEVARATGRSLTGVVRALVEVEEALGIDQIVERLRHVAVDEGDRWSHAAVRGLLDDLADLRRLGARRALAGSPDIDEREAMAKFVATVAAQVNRDHDPPPKNRRRPNHPPRRPTGRHQSRPPRHRLGSLPPRTASQVPDPPPDRPTRCGRPCRRSP